VGGTAKGELRNRLGGVHLGGFPEKRRGYREEIGKSLEGGTQGALKKKGTGPAGGEKRCCNGEGKKDCERTKPWGGRRRPLSQESWIKKHRQESRGGMKKGGGIIVYVEERRVEKGCRTKKSGEE